MSKDKTMKRTKNSSSVVLLRDLSPRKEVAGGGGKVLFGERREPTDDAPGAAQAGRSVKKTVKSAKSSVD
jgi:hypothetical protein